MKILVVGGGSIGRRHIRNLKSLFNHEIIVLKREYSNAFEKEFNVKVITSFNDPIIQEIDCLFVATPTSLHNESLTLANANKLHVFMEKPLIHNKTGKEKSISIWKNTESVFFIGYMLRFHPIILKIYSLLNSQILGSVYSARFEFGSYLPNWHPEEDYKLSYAAKENLGGGVINTITHEIDLIQYFFGMPNEVSCMTLNKGMLGIDVEEQCEAILKYNDKIVSLHLDFLQKKYERNIKILCENGVISWSWSLNELIIDNYITGERKCLVSEKFDVNQLYIDELKCFFELIESNRIKHDLDFIHAIQNTELLIMLSESAKK